MNSKGQAPIIFIVLIIGVAGVILFGLIKSNLIPLSKQSDVVQKTIPNSNGQLTDQNRKLLINSLPSYIQRYYSDHKKYPDDLSSIVEWLLKHPTPDLQKEGQILKEDIKSYKYINKGSSYELSVTLSDGTSLKAPSINPKEVDAMVQVDINNLVTMINIFYAEKQRYPQTLEELKTLPDFSKLDLPKQPDGQPYSYVIKGNSFSISGKLTSGEEYKVER